MKNLILLALVLLVSVGCKDNPVSKKIKETKEQVSNTKNAVQEMQDMQDDLEALKEAEPLTNEELKSWLPDEVMGMKRVAYKAGQGSLMQISSVEATYANEDRSKQFKVQVIDGAGEMGAAATAGMRLMFSQEFEEETERKIRRTITKNGRKAMEEFHKTAIRSSIQFMEDDRFFFHVTGNGMELDETWDAISELDAEDLG